MRGDPYVEFDSSDSDDEEKMGGVVNTHACDPNPSVQEILKSYEPGKRPDHLFHDIMDRLPEKLVAECDAVQEMIKDKIDSFQACCSFAASDGNSTLEYCLVVGCLSI